DFHVGIGWCHTYCDQTCAEALDHLPTHQIPSLELWRPPGHHFAAAPEASAAAGTPSARQVHFVPKMLSRSPLLHQN
ncbi:hypothetical protein, partial [Methylobacterium tardum]|uniref:hypothetical protein n=1 Tax=Methylobacterium tardum TaxID=374432 RepID=UPI0024E13B27